MMRLKCRHACQVLVWDSRSVVETSQLERHILISIRFMYLSRIRTTYAGSLRFKFLQTHQRAVFPVSTVTVEVIEGSNTRHSYAVHR
jgi:hypothetical protein